MTKKQLQKKILAVYQTLFDAYGPQKCALDHTNALELLVATILSAQCTDKKVNAVTPALFAKYPDAKAFANADPEELEQMVHPCGFYRAKAKNIHLAAQQIVKLHGGKVPGTMEELTALPGVGRKTANVLLGDAFAVPGMPVDTHVKRITNLLGLTKSDDPVQIESELCAALPQEYWSQFSHLIIAHGRTRCPARRPDCENCEIRTLCDYGLNPKRKK